jgi:uncharacterized OB-fold protein
MTGSKPEEFGDPTTAPFWAAAREHRLVIQRCEACGRHQFYPRPFCLECLSDRIEWVGASGRATIYSMTTVRVQIAPEFEPPYRVAVVDLEEGPRLLTTIVGPDCRIGDPVQVDWRDRAGGLPPLVVFSRR